VALDSEPSPTTPVFACGLSRGGGAQVKPLIWVECTVERFSRSRVEYMVKARSQFKERSTANSVEIELPLPPDAIDPTARTSMGTAAYAPERRHCSGRSSPSLAARSVARHLPRTLYHTVPPRRACWDSPLHAAVLLLGRYWEGAFQAVLACL